MLRAVQHAPAAQVPFSKSKRRSSLDPTDGLMYNALDMLLMMVDQNVGKTEDATLAEDYRGKLGALTSIVIKSGHDTECRVRRRFRTQMPLSII